MSQFEKTGDIAVREGAFQFRRLAGNSRTATDRALEQIAHDWDCKNCELAGISDGDNRCPICSFKRPDSVY